MNTVAEKYTTYRTPLLLLPTRQRGSAISITTPFSMDTPTHAPPLSRGALSSQSRSLATGTRATPHGWWLTRSTSPTLPQDHPQTANRRTQKCTAGVERARSQRPLRLVGERLPVKQHPTTPPPCCICGIAWLPRNPGDDQKKLPSPTHAGRRQRRLRRKTNGGVSFMRPSPFKKHEL